MTSIGAAAVAETHSAVVFFVGDRAYKMKKPIDLGFLDFRSLDARRQVCHDEVRLNRRLAPDAYLGVADVHGPDGEVCEHLVVMRRMPTERRLAHLVRTGAPVDDHLWHVAHRLAAFHAASAHTEAADVAAGRDATRHRWVTNTDALITASGSPFDEATVGLVHGLACRYLDGRGPLFDSRVAAGRAVDGHGDLLADDIFCLDEGPQILDCIEFDEALRLGDGLADAAFLAMDLEQLGRPDLGQRFLEAYREHRGDAWPASLAHHHIAYRAQVRAKVTAIRAQQGDPSARCQAVELLDLAARHLDRGRVRLVLVGGLPGTGKSTVADALGVELGAVVVSSDALRREQAGAPVEGPHPVPIGTGQYTEAAKDEVYAAMLRRAATALTRGESVVLDAAWTAERWRQAARRVAADGLADLAELRCHAPSALTADRILARLAEGRGTSDATPAVAAALAELDDPWPQAHTISTDGPLAATLDAARLCLARPR
ncbi:MAG: AAA family ATPase [Acidimicrobiales bacterium]